MAAIGSPSAILTRTPGGSTCPSGPGQSGAGGSKSWVTMTSELDEGFGTGVGSAMCGLTGTVVVGGAAAVVAATAAELGTDDDAQPEHANARTTMANPCQRCEPSDGIQTLRRSHASAAE